MTQKRRWSARSIRNLKGIHPLLVTIATEALKSSPIDFTVIEGRRTQERQWQLYARGASRTLRSRHLTGHAIDIAPLVNGEIRWDWPLFHRIAPHFKEAARRHKASLVWGGDWPTFPDGPHFELNPTAHPWDSSCTGK